MHERMTWPNSQPSDEIASDGDTWCEGYAQRSEDTPSVRRTPRVRGQVRPAYFGSYPSDGVQDSWSEAGNLIRGVRPAYPRYAQRNVRSQTL